MCARNEILIKAIDAFWDGKDQNGKTLSFETDEGKKEAICRAFKDLTVRTMSKNNKNTPVKLKDLSQAACKYEFEYVDGKICKGFISIINEWFENKEPNDDSFKIWHKKACQFIIEFLKGYYVEEDCTYGKAQKVVNMTFKGLYCLSGSEKYEKHFKFCHMPLDSFILEWFYRECKKQGKSIIKDKMSGWSSLNFAEKEFDIKGKYSYGFYQCTIEKLLEDKKFEGLTPLQADFIIWPDIQLQLAAEAFYFKYNNINDNSEKKYFKDKQCHEKLDMIKKALNTQ